jgi:hypothetical protein
MLKPSHLSSRDHYGRLAERISEGKEVFSWLGAGCAGYRSVLTLDINSDGESRITVVAILESEIQDVPALLWRGFDYLPDSRLDFGRISGKRRAIGPVPHCLELRCIETSSTDSESTPHLHCHHSVL